MYNSSRSIRRTVHRLRSHLSMRRVVRISGLRIGKAARAMMLGSIFGKVLRRSFQNRCRTGRIVDPALECGPGQLNQFGVDVQFVAHAATWSAGMIAPNPFGGSKRQPPGISRQQSRGMAITLTVIP
jgi:hypothetical protein